MFLRTFTQIRGFLHNSARICCLQRPVILPTHKTSGYHRQAQYFLEENYYYWSRRSFTKDSHAIRSIRIGADNESVPFGSQLQIYDWAVMKIPEVEKNFYNPHPSTLQRSSKEIEAFRKENRITIVHGEALNPTLEFDHIGFPEDITMKLKRCGFEKPMPIQAQGWPLALSGKNMIGIGETGSGKTLGFLLPAIVHIRNQQTKSISLSSPSEGPVALTLAPTRELAQQIHEVIRKFCPWREIPSACLVGGSHRQRQIQDLQEGVDIVTATPGRLIDLLQDNIINLERCSYVVLDEADRMLDMGFEPQIRQILSQVQPKRQLLMWSATWPKEVRTLAKDFFFGDYTHLNIGSTTLQANRNIIQKIIILDNFEKQKALKNLMKQLQQEEGKTLKTLIFCSTKNRVDDVVWQLKRSGYKVDGIHGDRSQANRTRTLRNFRKGQVNVLIATNVAARGLDVEDIKVVINYDYPNESEDYVHRIGRTGRQSKVGRSFAFFTTKDAPFAEDLIAVLKEAQQEIDPGLIELAKASKKSQRHVQMRKKPKKFNGR